MKKPFRSHSPAETIDFGKRLARKFSQGTVVGLCGGLGSGKTTLIQGFAEGLNVSRREVKSPTFVLFHIYNGSFPVYHFDWYRIEHASDLETDGFEDFLSDPKAISFIEWADRAPSLLPEDKLMIDLKDLGADERQLCVRAFGLSSRKILQSFLKDEHSRD